MAFEAKTIRKKKAMPRKDAPRDGFIVRFLLSGRKWVGNPEFRLRRVRS
jgi:hypothetical protein